MKIEKQQIIPNFSKKLLIGKSVDTGNVFIKVSFKDGNLSLSGVEGPKNSGKC